MRILRRIIAASLLLAPAITLAQGGGSFTVYCGNLPGCGVGADGEYLSDVFLLLLAALPQYIYIIATIFVMVGGARMILSAGRDDWVTKGKDTIFWALLAVGITVFATQIVSMVQAVAMSRVPGGDFALSVANTVGSLLFDLLYLTLLCIALYSGMILVISQGQEDSVTKAKTGLFWAAVGAIVINLAERLVNAFATL